MSGGDSLERYREDFPALNRRRRGKPAVYFDNACTTLVPTQVIEAMNEYYEDFPSCGGGRSRHWFAEEVTTRLKASRRTVAEFINAASEKEIIFTMNTSHAINAVALGFRFRPGDNVLLTDKEHNSNLLPWLRLQEKGIIGVDRTVPGAADAFDLEDFERRMKNGRIRLVSMAFTSNTTGHTIPAKEIVNIAHEHGARVLLDGAQTVPHAPVDVRDLDVDFLAFSLHKMCGPRGVGVLYGKGELLAWAESEGGGADNVVESTILGGGTVDDATHDSYNLFEAPGRFEAGIQDYAGQIASGAAIKYLRDIGMDRIRAHEVRLNSYLTEEISSRYESAGWFKILGPRDAAERGGILTFEVKRPNAIGIAEQLSDKNNIMIRDGVFCAHSYFNERYGVGWMRPRAHAEHRMVYRVSLYFYNTMEECRTFLDTLHEVFEERSYI